MSNDPDQFQESPSEQPLYEFATNDGGPVGYGAPFYEVGTPPLPSYPPPETRRGRQRLWIVLGIAGLILVLLTCGSCVAVGYLGARFLQQGAGSAVVALEYYGALRQQHYDIAYSYLAPEARIEGRRLTLDAFTRLARDANARDGELINALPSTFRQTGSETAIVTLLVTRSRRTYQAILRLRRIGNTWQITSANTI